MKNVRNLRKRIIWSLSLFLVLVLVTYLIVRPSRQHRILEPVVILNENRQLCKKIFTELQYDRGPGSDDYIKELLGGETLSMRLAYLMEYETEWGYEIYHVEGAVGDVFNDFVNKNLTIVRMQDISIETWQDQADGSFSGSFSFKNKVISGRCLFDGKNDQVKRLVFAKRGSDKIEDGLAIFGCDFGKEFQHNYFIETFYLHSDALPDLPYSSKGEFWDKREKHDAVFPININAEGLIKVNGTPFAADEFFALRGWLETHINEFGQDKVLVVLAIEARVAKGIQQRVRDLINELNLPMYRVVRSDGSNPKFPKGCLLGEKIK